jgi:hypothetical protein
VTARRQGQLITFLTKITRNITTFADKTGRRYYLVPMTSDKTRTLTASRLTADGLFGVQILFALIFGGSEFYRLLTTRQGVNLTWFLCWLIFSLLNLTLTFRAHQNQPSRVTLQTFLSYATWTAMVAADLAVMLWKGTHIWGEIDTITAIVVGLGAALTVGLAYRLELGIIDPMVKGWLAVFFKAVPQLALAYKIFLHGGAGLAAAAVITGHITILSRLGLLWFSIKEAGWDRNRRGSALSEIANELSWLTATVVWLVS